MKAERKFEDQDQDLIFNQSPHLDLRIKNLPSRTEKSSLTNIQTHWIKALADQGCCPPDSIHTRYRIIKVLEDLLDLFFSRIT